MLRALRHPDTIQDLRDIVVQACDILACILTLPTYILGARARRVVCITCGVRVYRCFYFLDTGAHARAHARTRRGSARAGARAGACAGGRVGARAGLNPTIQLKCPST